MSEQGESVNQEPKPIEGPRNLSRRRFIGGAAIGVGATLLGAIPASAETPSPTPTAIATATLTPDPNTVEGLKKIIADQAEKNQKEAEKADLIKKATAQVTTPTITVTPNATATEEVFIRSRTAVVETAEANAQPIASSTPKPASTAKSNSTSGGSGNEGNQEEWSLPAKGVTAVAAVTALAAVGVSKSVRFKGLVNRGLGLVSGGRIQIP